MKTYLFRFLRFFRSQEGPTAMESALFFGLIVALCLVSAKMASRNLASEPLQLPSFNHPVSSSR